ncbi:MAG: hypothetical protein N2C13_05330 [Chloroflexota bacterium]
MSIDGLRRKHRLAGIMLGFMLVFWLPVEDTNAIVLMGLSASLSAWLAMQWWLKRTDEEKNSHFLVLGTLGGLVVSMIAMLFIAIKAGLHAHGFTDFAPTQLRDILLSTPWWGLAGLLSGFVAKRLQNKDED